MTMKQNPMLKAHQIIKQPLASVIVRTKNEEALIGETLTAVYNQEVRDIEVILVDSGSTDRTLEIARTFPVQVIEITPEEFTYGRALNIGCEAARGEILVLVSAHAVPLTAVWLTFLLSHFDQPNVAAVWGACTRKKTDRPKVQVVRQSLELFLSRPEFGLSNTNAAIRANVWQRYPFDERLPYTEDKEWSWRVLSDGYTLVHDGRALVWHHHADTLRQIWYRSHLEHVGYARFLQLVPPSRIEVLQRICGQTCRASWHAQSWRQRVGALTAGLPTVIAREIGRYTGLHAARTTAPDVRGETTQPCSVNK